MDMDKTETGINFSKACIFASAYKIQSDSGGKTNIAFNYWRATEYSIFFTDIALSWL